MAFLADVCLDIVKRSAVYVFNYLLANVCVDAGTADLGQRVGQPADVITKCEFPYVGVAHHGVTRYVNL